MTPTAPAAGQIEPIVPWSCEFKRKACRNPDGCHCAEIESLQVRINQAADALAAKDAIIKMARVALEGVEFLLPNERGLTALQTCPSCFGVKYKGHKPNCPIGAALEAMGK